MSLFTLSFFIPIIVVFIWYFVLNWIYTVRSTVLFDRYKLVNYEQSVDIILTLFCLNQAICHIDIITIATCLCHICGRVPKTWIFIFICLDLFSGQWVLLKWEVIVRFVDIGEIDDHHCYWRSRQTLSLVFHRVRENGVWYLWSCLSKSS